jgi:hypothetical protein
MADRVALREKDYISEFKVLEGVTFCLPPPLCRLLAWLTIRPLN